MSEVGMMDREKVIKRLERCVLPHGNGCTPECEYHGRIECCRQVMRKALALLKAQEPRLVVKEDFENADKYGYLPVFVESRDGEMYWDCITDAALGDTVSRFWTTKPTDEQRKAVKWDEYEKC